MQGVHLEILSQPDDTTCGPTCLQAVYAYWNDVLPLEQVIHECGELQEGGTLASLLGRHALERRYEATMYTFNLRVFDPIWFGPRGTVTVDLEKKLQAQIDVKDNARLQHACRAYLEFLRRGGHVKMVDLTRRLIRDYLNRSVPILTGLSSTFLYRAAREIGPECTPDDIRGLPTGHFVVLCGYDRRTKMVRIADPYLPNPLGPHDNYYEVSVDRVVCAILLGALTYDANLLILKPRESPNTNLSTEGTSHGDADRRQ